MILPFRGYNHRFFCQDRVYYGKQEHRKEFFHV